MKSKILLILFLALSFSNLSQEKESEPLVVQEDKSLEGQFDYIYRISATYQVYKVIGKDQYLELKKNVLDSLKDAKSLISEKENLLKTERDNIKATKELLLKTQLELVASKKNENSISLFGSEFSKTTYNLLLWSIIIVSLLGLFYFIFKFSQSNVLTKEAQKNLFDVEQEFEQHRKKSLEREQKLRRQLQDEVNKSRSN